MIYLLPFVTCFLIYAMQVKGMILSKPYLIAMQAIEKVISLNKNKFINKTFQYAHKALGGCLVCFSGWIGIFILVILVLLGLKTFTPITFICIALYNSIASSILFRLLTK